MLWWIESTRRVTPTLSPKMKHSLLSRSNVESTRAMTTTLSLKNETWPVQSRSSLMQQQQKQPENVHLSGSHNWPIFNICIFDHFNWRDLMLCKCGIKSQKNTTNISQITLNCLKQSGNLCLFPKENLFGWIQNCKKSKFWKLQANATDVLHHIYSCFLLLGKSLPAQHRCLLCSSTYLCDLTLFIL